MQGDGAEVGLGRDDIKAHLPPGWEELAIERGLIGPPRPYLGAKVTAIEPVLRLVFHHAGLESSLKITTAAAAAAGMITLSAVALHKWERKLAPYLAELLGRMVESNATFAREHWGGYEIVLADGTVITRPESEGVEMRVCTTPCGCRTCHCFITVQAMRTAARPCARSMPILSSCGSSIEATPTRRASPRSSCAERT